MSVNVNVIGRLGADAEARKSKVGNDFISFRVATDEYQKGEKTTTWLNVVYSCANPTQMVEYLKKGRMVNVIGEETVRLYQDKNGVCQISRDIIAYRVNFVNSGNGQSNNTEAQTQQLKTADATPMEQPTPQFAIPDTDDDLPF